MTKEITKIENSAVKLTATIAQADVSDGYKTSLSRYAKNIQIPGFRKGHVPVSVLEQKYGESLKAEVLGDLIDQALNEILQGEDAKDFRPLPYAQPRLENDKMPEFNLDNDLTFTVTYDVFPKVEVNNFDGIVIKEPQVTVSDSDLQDELKSIQERNATVLDKKDGDPVEKDDIVTVDYKELDENGSVIAGSERESFVFRVGSGENIYKFDDDVIGLKKDESKEITKTYSADEDDEELAGKTKKISVTIKAIKVRNLPELDDDLAQDVNEKYKTLDDLKADIKNNMEVAKNRKLEELKKQSLLEQLVEKNPIELPLSMVNAEKEARWRMIANQFQTTPQELDKLVLSSGQTRDEMLVQWAGDTEKMLKSRLILDKLLSEKNITVTPEEVEAEYSRIAEEVDSSVEEVKSHYESAKEKEYLIDDIKEKKLYEELYKQVTVQKGENVAFADLFKTVAN